jgi:hypothetical protein
MCSYRTLSYSVMYKGSKSSSHCQRQANGISAGAVGMTECISVLSRRAAVSVNAIAEHSSMQVNGWLRMWRRITTGTCLYEERSLRRAKSN